MRKMSIDVYSLEELCEDSKQRAYHDWLKYNAYEHDAENRQTLNVFCERFGVRCTRSEYDAQGFSYRFQLTVDDKVSELSGVRLLKYIINKHWKDFYQAKRYDKGNTRRESRINSSVNATLTGYVADEAILFPIEDFLYLPDKKTSYERLMDKCLESFFCFCQEDIEDTTSYETFDYECELNGWEFFGDGMPAFIRLDKEKPLETRAVDKESLMVEFASQLAEKEMSDNHNLLPEDFADENGSYLERYQDEFNALYDKYYNLFINLIK